MRQRTDIEKIAVPYLIGFLRTPIRSISGFYQIAWQTIACGRDKSVLGLPASSKLSIRRPSGTGRRPGDDDHTRLQSEAGREKMDEIGTTPNHISSIAELAQLAVYSRADVKYPRVWNFVGGDDPRAKWCAAIKSLSPTQLVPSEVARTANLTIIVP
jgi:hypothetical protein